MSLCASHERASLPPPVALRLEGATEEKAREHMSLYKLEPGKTSHGRPVWRDTRNARYLLGFSGFSWQVTDEDGLKSGGCFLTATGECASPDLLEKPWEVHTGAWTPMPEVRCVVADADERHG